MFDALLDQMRTHSTRWLEARRLDVINAQRELRSEELAITRVLDERGRIDTSLASAGESARVVREKVETARRLESLPSIAAVAHDGRLSNEQLWAIVQIADESSDAEWAERAPDLEASELQRMARRAIKPSADDGRARHAARSFKMWWTADKTMLQVHGQLPDVMGAEFEGTITKLTEQMKPGKGQAWDTFEHRAADALVQLCGNRGDDTPTLASQPVLQVLVPATGPAEIAGVPIPDSLLEQLRADATIEPVLVDHDEIPVGFGRCASALSPKIRRAVLLRDGRCRMPGCARRRGLETHHLTPRTWGGTDDVANLAAVCPTHHRQLVPYGKWALVGNPNQPDGLQLVDAEGRAPP